MKSLALISLIFALNSCSPSVQVVHVDNDVNIPVSNSSIVSLIEPIELTDSDGVPNGYGYSETCNAFAVLDVNVKYLVTAGHCLDGYPIGSTIRYLATDGVGHGKATVEFISSVSDKAILSISDPKLVPFRVDASYEPAEDDYAFTVSSIYSGVSSGNVIGKLTHGWYDTTQNVRFGWSGSPVLNEHGDAWGIIAMCRLDEVTQQCFSDYAIVASIY